MRGVLPITTVGVFSLVQNHFNNLPIVLVKLLADMLSANDVRNMSMTAGDPVGRQFHELLRDWPRPSRHEVKREIGRIVGPNATTWSICSMNVTQKLQRRWPKIDFERRWGPSAIMPMALSFAVDEDRFWRCR